MSEVDVIFNETLQGDAFDVDVFLYIFSMHVAKHDVEQVLRNSGSFEGH